jgi:hypothetical protein
VGYRSVSKGLHVFDRLIVLIQQAMRAHFIQEKGLCEFFGKIVGYRYRQSFDISVFLDTSGEMLRVADDSTPSPTGYLRVGRRIISTVDRP